MSKKAPRKPTAFRVEEVEMFTPPAAPEMPAEITPLPARPVPSPISAAGSNGAAYFSARLAG